MPRDRRSSLRTLFEVRGLTWVVLLGGSVLLLTIAYAITRAVVQ